MKKLALLLLALAIVIPAFADDAKVLPAGVLRTYLVLANQSFDEMYDDDGDTVDAAFGGVSAWSTGIALEYGITDQITAALQWTPAWVFSSEFEDPFSAGPFPENDKATVNGLADLFIGAKAQILGPNGFVANDAMRLAAAAGVKIPLSQYDGEDEFDAYLDGDEFSYSAPTYHALGYGFRLYYDYLVTDSFWINLYNETIFYAPTETKEFGDTTDVEYEYGYDLTLEVEPHYDYKYSDTLTLSAALPFTYTKTPETVVDGTGDDLDTNLLTIGPNVSAFWTGGPLPLELEVGYALPLMGKNNAAAKTFAVIFKSYMKF